MQSLYKNTRTHGISIEFLVGDDESLDSKQMAKDIIFLAMAINPGEHRECVTSTYKIGLHAKKSYTAAKFLEEHESFLLGLGSPRDPA